MVKLKTYDQFVNEALIDAVKNPIKWKKIKNNAKKYQKAKVAQALNDVDFAKKKAKGKVSMTAKQKEVLAQANKAKNAALKDQADAITQRMNDLATTDGLKKVAALARTKSNLAANKIVLKAADGEEAKQLKIKQTALSKKAAEQGKALADYEDTSSDSKDDNEGEAAAKLEKGIKDFQSNMDAAQETKKKAKEALVKLGDKKKEQEKKGTGGEDGEKAMDKINKEITKQERLVTGADEDYAELKKKRDGLKDKLANLTSESFEYVAESVSQKFARLRSNL
tara:strand:- start:134 stop:976 length:843 start_codon:yes stop_codon:yes gene_type:complete